MQARGFGCSPVAGLLRWLAQDQQPSPRPRRTAPSPTRTTPSPAMALTTPRGTQRAPRQKRICVPPWRTMAASCNWVPSSSSNRIGQGSSAKARPRKGAGRFRYGHENVYPTSTCCFARPGTTANARSRSAIRSSAFSIPTEIRTSCSVTPIFCRSSERIMA